MSAPEVRQYICPWMYGQFPDSRHRAAFIRQVNSQRMPNLFDYLKEVGKFAEEPMSEETAKETVAALAYKLSNYCPECGVSHASKNSPITYGLCIVCLYKKNTGKSGVFNKIQ